MASATITVTANTRWAVLFIRSVRVIAPVLALIVGPQRLLDFTAAVARRLVRVQFGG